MLRTYRKHAVCLTRVSSLEADAILELALLIEGLRDRPLKQNYRNSWANSKCIIWSS